MVETTYIPNWHIRVPGINISFLQINRRVVMGFCCSSVKVHTNKLPAVSAYRALYPTLYCDRINNINHGSSNANIDYLKIHFNETNKFREFNVTFAPFVQIEKWKRHIQVNNIQEHIHYSWIYQYSKVKTKKIITHVFLWLYSRKIVT